MTKEVIGIALSRVSLTGTINAEIGVLRKLKEIDMSENSLYGTIPEDIRKLKQLKILNFAYNKIEGTVEGFGRTLEVLNVTNNYLNGPLYADFGSTAAEVPKLKVFDASRNEIGGVIPSPIGMLYNLEFLDLGFNKVSKHYTLIYISMNHITILIPKKKFFHHDFIK